MDILIWLTVAVSMTICLAKASIFEPGRTLILSAVPAGMDEAIGELLYCSQCLGFWIGFAGYLLFPLYHGGISLGISSVFAGFVVSTLSIAMDKLIYGRTSQTEGKDEVS